MIITEYRNIRSPKSAKVKDYTWNDFCNKIKNPVVKYGMPWETFMGLPDGYDRDDDGKVIDWGQETKESVKNLAGGAVYGEMVLPAGAEIGRNKEHFPMRSAIVFDYEHCGPEIFGRVQEALQGITYCYHTTCKCRIPDDVRIHIIIPFSKPVNWDMHCVVAVDLARKIGLQGLDVSCLAKNQMELYCVLLRNNEYKYHINNEDFLDGEKYLTEHYGSTDVMELSDKMKIDWSEFKLPDLISKSGNKIAYKIGNKVVRTAVREFNFKPNVPIAGDVKSCFNSCFSCRDLLDMIPEKYISVGERYRYYKGSGSAGVWVSDDGTLCGSWHSDSGDPLNKRRAWTAFDLYLLYFCKGLKKYSEKKKKAHQFALSKYKDKYLKLYHTVKISFNIAKG